MVVFVHDDAAYHGWILRHRDGFVLDWKRGARSPAPRLHRARCAELRDAVGRHGHGTTGRRTKACSLAASELRDWANEEIGRPAVACALCAPDAAEPPTPVAPRAGERPSRLGREILEVVIEAAVIHLDRRDGAYTLAVADVAQALGKTPAQLRGAITRLLAEGHLETDAPPGRAAPLAGGAALYPTPRSLRALPAFADASDEQLAAELLELHAIQARSARAPRRARRR